MNDHDQLITFLGEQKYMTIAVTLPGGTPWATPVRIKKREGKVFEWESKTDTAHSGAIRAQPVVAISIWTPEAENSIQFGFYAHATAEQISEANEHGIAVYRATVSKSFINDATFKKREVSLG